MNVYSAAERCVDQKYLEMTCNRCADTWKTEVSGFKRTVFHIPVTIPPVSWNILSFIGHI